MGAFTTSGLDIPGLEELADGARDGVDARMRARSMSPMTWDDDNLAEMMVQEGARLAYEGYQELQAAWWAIAPASATGSHLDRLLARLVRRRGGVRSQYIFRVAANEGTKLYPEGYLLDLADVRWRVTTDTELTTASTKLPVEAVDYGASTLTVAGTAEQVTPIAGVTSVTFDPATADAFQVGRVRELDPTYRVRASLELALRGASAPGLRNAMFRALAWVQAVSMEPAGVAGVRLTVVPAPTAAQRPDLARLLLNTVAFPTPFEGANTEDVALPGGGVYTVAWDDGAQLAVTWAVTLTTDGTPVTDQALQDAVTAAVQGAGQLLSRGETLLHIDVFCAIAAIPQVKGIGALTLNGSSGDVVPTDTQTIVVGDGVAS